MKRSTCAPSGSARPHRGAVGSRASRVGVIRTAWILAAVLAVAGAAAAADAPDLILAGGKVFTADPARPWAEAVAIAGDHIVAVGSSAEVRPLAGSATRVIELQKRVVVPGFNDAHMHAGAGPGPGVGLSFPSNDPALADVLKALATEAARAPAGTWLRADIGVRVLDDPTATRATLDTVTPSHPVFLTGWTGHGGLLNTAALHALGVADDQPDPPGGWFGRVRGTPQLSGIVHEYALVRLERRLGEQVSHADAVANVRRYVQEALKLGITSVQDMGTSLPAPALADLLREAGAPLRWRVIRFSLEPPSADERRGRQGPGRQGRRRGVGEEVDPRRHAGRAAGRDAPALRGPAGLDGPSRLSARGDPRRRRARAPRPRAGPVPRGG